MRLSYFIENLKDKNVESVSSFDNKNFRFGFIYFFENSHKIVDVLEKNGFCLFFE